MSAAHKVGDQIFSGCCSSCSCKSVRTLTYYFLPVCEENLGNLDCEFLFVSNVLFACVTIQLQIPSCASQEIAMIQLLCGLRLSLKQTQVQFSPFEASLQSVYPLDKAQCITDFPRI